MSKIAFLFPGQGAQTVGMGQTAFRSSAAVRELFDWASEFLGYDLATLCFEGPAEQLDSTVYSQPALYICGLAGLKLLQEESPDVVEQCSMVAGLSLGEYTALACAGAVTAESGLRLVQQRGMAMQAASDISPSGMVSVIGLERDALQALCDEVRREGEVLQIANFLCPATTVVSGSRQACERITEAATSAGALKTVEVPVSGAFHTPCMQPAVAPLATAIQQTDFAAASVPVICNVDAKPHQSPEEIRPLLVQQVVSPVLWEESMKHMIDAGNDCFYEIGPGRVLRGLLKRINRKIPCKGVEI